MRIQIHFLTMMHREVVAAVVMARQNLLNHNLLQRQRLYHHPSNPNRRHLPHYGHL
jgi:hypothetical protein